MSYGTGNVPDVRMTAIRDSDEFLPQYVTNRWLGWYRSESREKWQEETAEVKRFLYAADTSDTSNVANPHSHTTHRPKLAQIADALEAHYMDALFPHDEWLQFVPGASEDMGTRKRRIFEAYLRNRHSLYGHRMVSQQLIRDWIEEGCAYAEVVFRKRLAQRTEEGLDRLAYVGPEIRRIDPRRVAYNYSATSFSDSWKVVQSVKTKGDIMAEIMDETLGEEYREILKKAMEFRAYVHGYGDALGEEWLYSSYDGFGSNGGYYGQGDTVEILTFYGSIWDTDQEKMHHNRKIVVIDRKWVLSNDPIDTWDGKPLIYRTVWRQKPNSLMCMGPLQNLTGMQYMINHLQNVRADAFDKMVYPDRLYRSIEDARKRPDGTTDFFTHDGDGMVQNISPDTTVLNADNQIAMHERAMEEYAGVPPEAMGMKTPGEQTKFEVAERLTAAGRLFNSKVAKYEDEMVVPSLNAEMELAKRELDENLSILVSLEEGDIWQEITPDTLKNKGTFRAVGARHYAQQQRLSQDLQGLMQAIQMDPEIAVHFPPRKIALAWDRYMGSFGTADGLYEEFGRLAEQVEAQQMQQAAAGIVDNAAIAQQQISDPALSEESQLPI